MPLVKLFVHRNLTKPVNLPSIQSKLCAIWGVKPETTKCVSITGKSWIFIFAVNSRQEIIEYPNYFYSLIYLNIVTTQYFVDFF